MRPADAGGDSTNTMVLALDTIPRKAAAACLAAAATLGISFPVLSQYQADRYARLGTRENLEKALEWQPQNAALHNRLGLTLLYSAENPERAQGELQRATEMEPGNGRFWVDLALARELAGDVDGARAALVRARSAEPRTPAILWQETNFELRHDSADRALELTRQLLAGAPEYTSRALPVLSRVMAPAALVETAVPQQRDALNAAIEFLRGEDHPEGVEAVWSRVLSLNQSPGEHQIRQLVNWLIASGHLNRATRVWNDAAAKGWTPVDAATSNQPLYNADFSHPISNFGFDWRVTPHPEASVWIEASGPTPGSQSLCVQFFENARQGYAHVTHLLRVRSSYHYSLRASLRSQGLISRAGAALVVRDPHSSVRMQTESVYGTDAWKDVALSLETSPGTNLLELALVRPAPQPKEEPGAGLVCVGGLKWEPLGPSKR